MMYLAIELPRAEGPVASMVPESSETFLEGFMVVLRACIEKVDPGLHEAGTICIRVCAIILLVVLLKGISEKDSLKGLELASVTAIGCVLLSPSVTLIRLGEEAIRSQSAYGKLLLPVMTGAMAAQGATASSAGLYAVTAFLDSVLSTLLSNLILPALYLYLGLSIANAATGEGLLGKLKDLFKWFMTWVLKMVLYGFTGFLSITGVVSGAADATAVKAAKLAISGAVPVIGGILSDASEAVLVGAGLVKNSLGMYGLLTALALYLSPFFQIGTQYLMMKATAAVSVSLGKGPASALVSDFATAMGLILAVVSVQTVLLVVSTVCFMRGVG